MPLGFDFSVNDGSNIIPIVKYNASAGRVSRVDRTNGVSNPVDITRNFQAVFDLENLEVGQMYFAQGAAPSFLMVRHGETIPEPPTPNHRMGVRVLIKLTKECGGDVRELCSNAKSFLSGFERLFDAYEAEKADHKGQLPVVSIEDVIAVTVGQSVSYAPTFKIERWVNRPADLTYIPSRQSSPAAAAAEPAKSSFPSTGSSVASAPSPFDADEDFG